METEKEQTLDTLDDNVGYSISKSRSRTCTKRGRKDASDRGDEDERTSDEGRTAHQHLESSS